MTGPANAVSVWIETSRVGICEGKAQQFIRRHLEVYGRVAVDAAASERQLAIPSRGVAILASELTSSKSKIRILIRCNKIELLSREHSIDHRRGFVLFPQAHLEPCRTLWPAACDARGAANAWHRSGPLFQIAAAMTSHVRPHTSVARS